MNQRVIMTGFHFPPSAISSGHLRLLAFAKYLPEFGWDPVVLSATKGAYEHIDPASIQSIPPGCSVHRAFALDARRHFGLYGRYPSLLAQPDRWSNWWPSAVSLGLWLIKRYRAQAIWSTFPIMTSHCVAYTLSRLTGIPWIADFRDPVATAVAHKNPMTVRTQMRWERRVVSQAARSVFTTPGAMQWCAERYPGVHRQHRLAVIENGYDEATFEGLPRPPPIAGRPIVLLHSGLLYQDGRNPVPLFEALASLKASGRINADDLKVVLRASGCESSYAQEIERLNLGDIVTLAPPIPNRNALIEQAEADALLLFQGSKFNRQIPAKMYEYLRIGHPIFALVDPHGDTADVLRATAGAELVPLEDTAAIEARLAAFIVAVREGRAPTARRDVVARYSRKEGAHSLARLLQQVNG
jgi:hypothetical protein